MLEVRIEGDNNKEEMKNVINSQFHDEINIEVEEFKDRFTLIIKSENPKDDFYESMANGIQTIITEYYLDEIIEKRIEKIYDGEIKIEDQSILDEIKYEIGNLYSHRDEKMKIKNEIIKYIKDNETLVLEGYIRFRLYNYLYLLDIAIDKIIAEIEEDAKVDEFFDKIQDFVEIQRPLVPYLNLILEDDGFAFKDIDSREIGQEVIEQVKERFGDFNVSNVDILISSLVMMAPNRIIIHTKKGTNNSIIAIIAKVFGNKAVVCKGCNICGFNLD